LHLISVGYLESTKLSPLLVWRSVIDLSVSYLSAPYLFVPRDDGYTR
jgi:hypothetical protein